MLYGVIGVLIGFIGLFLWSYFLIKRERLLNKRMGKYKKRVVLLEDEKKRFYIEVKSLQEDIRKRSKEVGDQVEMMLNYSRELNKSKKDSIIQILGMWADLRIQIEDNLVYMTSIEDQDDEDIQEEIAFLEEMRDEVTTSILELDEVHYQMFGYNYGGEQLRLHKFSKDNFEFSLN